jgi:hypothetical protein
MEEANVGQPRRSKYAFQNTSLTLQGIEQHFLSRNVYLLTTTTTATTTTTTAIKSSCV